MLVQVRVDGELLVVTVYSDLSASTELQNFAKESMDEILDELEHYLREYSTLDSIPSKSIRLKIGGENRVLVVSFPRTHVVELPEPEMSPGEIVEFLESNTDEIEDALDLNPDRQSARLEFQDYDIDFVDASESQVSIEYTVNYYEHSPCKDMSGPSQFCRTITGSICNNQIVFQVFEQPDPPSTFDEF